MRIPNFIKSLIVGVPIGVTFLDVIGYVARVDGISMQPVLNPDKDSADYVFLSRWSVRFHEVTRGDIISLKSPKDPDQRIIKRIVGLEGQYYNDVRLCNYLNWHILGDIVATLGYKKEIVRVPEGHCWVEGDHTGHSMDSNNFGPVSIGLVTAKATCVVWPPSRWHYIESFIPKRRLPLNLNPQYFS